jgi:hypothetical protein
MIADFAIDKMNSYITAGSRPETAAHFTRGELEAIYKGNHWSRDASGSMRKTLLPEALHVIPAMKKAEAAITEILKYCYETAGKGQPMNAEKHTAPEIIHCIKKTGLEGLKNYVMETA